MIEPGESEGTALVAVTSPAAIELRGSRLWITTDAFVPDATGAPQAIGKRSLVRLSYDADTTSVTAEDGTEGD